MWAAQNCFWSFVMCTFTSKKRPRQRRFEEKAKVNPNSSQSALQLLTGHVGDFLSLFQYLNPHWQGTRVLQEIHLWPPKVSILQKKKHFSKSIIYCSFKCGWISAFVRAVSVLHHILTANCLQLNILCKVHCHQFLSLELLCLQDWWHHFLHNQNLIVQWTQ